ncbi:MAG TPA: hypothetical protein DCQ31_15925, partial [Bacteroidales bacterium]|nr:hypothetical protein [Bacteroidales bacterium]
MLSNIVVKNNLISIYMKKFLLYSALTLILVLVILVILPFVFKDKIQQKVQTELDNTIDATIVLDDFSLNLFKNFPNFTASLSKFGIIGKGEFENDTLMYFNTLSIELDLGSVLAGNPKIVGIIALEPYFKVKFGESGKGNFDIMKPSDAPTDTTAAEPSTFKMAIEEIGLVGGTFIYDDVPGNMQMVVNGLDGIVSGDVALSVSQLKAVVTAKSIDFIMDKVKFMDAATAEFTSDITVDLDAFKFTFGNNASKLNNMPIRFEGWLAMPYDDIDMDFTFDLYQATFKDLLSMVPAIYATNFEGLKATGNVACNGFIKGTYNDVS